jgi:EAL domain-containing protein (putative c-di-GMP-specific phosphodiesterase class I)
MIPRIVPVYQPVLDLSSSRFAWFYALARFDGDDTQRAHIPFLQIAEDVGVIHEVDFAVLRRVIRLFHPAELPISVNLSVLTIDQHTNELIDILDVDSGAASALILEITETVPIRDIETIREFCEMARLLGCKIAVDDYGAGYFTAELVKRIAPDVIKLSQSLVNKVVATDDLSLLLEINGVASAIGAEVVAEGIDTLEKLKLLGSLGSRYAQGYLIARPGNLHSFWDHHLYPASILSRTRAANLSPTQAPTKYKVQKTA